jgi:hypothetical protein
LIVPGLRDYAGAFLFGSFTPKIRADMSAMLKASTIPVQHRGTP